MSDEPIWMEASDAIIVHDAELAAHGGSEGIRDIGLLESALAKPKNLWNYGEPRPSLQRLAASYAFGISSNHSFVDGNKRTALIISFVFCALNGLEVVASQEEAYLTFMALAAGKLSEEELASWFERNTRQ